VGDAPGTVVVGVYDGLAGVGSGGVNKFQLDIPITTDSLTAVIKGSDRMKLLCSYQTVVGTFFIGRSNDGRYHPIFDDESLGSYFSAQQALADLTNNSTFSVSHPKTGALLDTSALGISDDLREWSPR